MNAYRIFANKTALLIETTFFSLHAMFLRQKRTKFEYNARLKPLTFDTMLAFYLHGYGRNFTMYYALKSHARGLCNTVNQRCMGKHPLYFLLKSLQVIKLFHNNIWNRVHCK